MTGLPQRKAQPCSTVSGDAVVKRFVFTWRQMALPVACLTSVVGGVSVPSLARAEHIENRVAVFSALDKVTARISKFEVPLNKTETFGALTVTPRVCYTRPPTEEPKTTSFVEVDEKKQDGSSSRIFTGWMFAESPGLYGVEHPTYDVWLTGCREPRTQSAAASAASSASEDPGRVEDQPPSASAREQMQETRRRLRR